MNGHAKFVDQRRRLWLDNRNCHWCGVQTVLPVGKSPLPNWATIDHLDPRGSPERGKHAGEYRRVLACWKCNNERSTDYWNGKSLEEIWRENGHWTRMALQTGALPSEVSETLTTLGERG